MYTFPADAEDPKSSNNHQRSSRDTHTWRTWTGFQINAHVALALAMPRSCVRSGGNQKLIRM